MAGRGRRMLVLVCGVVGVGYLALLAYLRWGDIPGLRPTAMPQDESSVVELWDAYQQARTVAQVEAEDAQLVSASTQWQTVDEQTLLTGTGNWSFVFYSAASGNVLDIVVSTTGAQVVDQTRVWIAPGVLVEGAWETGPRDALLVFLAYGGREFLDEHPGSAVDLHLAEGESESPVWTIVALDVSDRSLFSLLIDAGTMQVLSIAP